MSKNNGSKKVQVAKPVKNYSSFTNSAGWTYAVKGMSPLLPAKIQSSLDEEFRKAGNFPEIPTYTVPATDVHEEEIHEHDPSTLVVEGDPEQTETNRKVWAEYIQRKAVMNSEYNSRLMRAVLLSIEATPTQGWRDEMKFMGVTLPTENSAAERYAFIETQVIHSAKDMADLMLSVFQLTGIVSEAAMSAVQDTFQSAMEEAFAEAGKPGGKK